MPAYDYDCAACGRRIEVVHGVHAPGPTHCPNCGEGPLKKAISAPAVHFKGSGWAKRDRRATVAPSTARSTGDTGASSARDADGGKAADSTSDDRTGTGSGTTAERPAGSAKTGGTGTATKTD